MAGEVEKKHRATAKRKFTRLCNSLTEDIHKGSVKEIIEEKYLLLKSLWDDLQSKHEDYLFAAFPDQEEPSNPDEEEYISKLENSFEIIQKLKYDYGHQIEDQKDKEEEQKAKRELIVDTKVADEKIKLEQRLFKQDKENLNNMLLSDGEGYLKQQISSALKDLKQRLEKCNDALLIYLRTASGIVPDEKQKAIDELYQGYKDVNDDCLKYFGRISKQDAERHAKPVVRLERMKLPSFNGDIRNYACFKSDFERQVEPQTRKEDLAYTLKSCLSGKALKEVECVDDEYDKMWKRLDNKFGRPALLVDAIMVDIRKSPRLKENDNQSLVTLIDTVERGYSSLSRISMGNEMSNSITLSMIEEKLPHMVRREWSKLVNVDDSKVDRSNPFPQFLKFLLQQRRILEYEMADLRISSNENHEYENPPGVLHGHGSVVPYNKPVVATPPNFRSPKCIFHNTSGHSTEECRNYLDMSQKDKIELIKTKQACWSCLKAGHRVKECQNRIKCNIDSCDKHHHKSLHTSNINGAGYTVSEGGEFGLSNCLLPVMKISSGSKVLSTLWDSGASISLITFKTAERLNLKGRQVNLSVYKIGGEIENISSYKYVLPLIDRNGVIVNINVYGIKQISKPVSSIDTVKIHQIFPELQYESVERMFNGGEIELLIGFDYASLHPVKDKSVGNLLLMRNVFGHCVAGCTESKVDQMLVNNVVINHITKHDDFLTIESMGVQCSPRCGSCRCGKCSVGKSNCTIKEEKEQQLIESGLSFKGSFWEVTYPWIKNPEDLPDNKYIAVKMLQSTERRIMKNLDYASRYNEQIKDMLNRKVACKLTHRELENYNGPYYYLTHHEILKHDSSTDFRIVFHSSLKYLGYCINDYWGKGPNLLNNLLGILFRFREESIAMTGDIKKMYHAIKLSNLDQHTHRFLWRDCDTEREPDTYVMTSVSFGDKPSPNIAITALNKTAEMSESEFPHAINVIKNNTYIDDIIDSFPDLETAEKVAKQIDEVIVKGNFMIKEWSFSAKDVYYPQTTEQTVKFAQNSETSVLGLIWDRFHDVLRYHIKLNFSPKKRGIFSGPDVNRSTVLQNIPSKLTKRIVLSKINSIYDPMGLITPFTITAKIILKKLWQKKLDWDDEIVDPEKTEITEFFVSMFQLEDISFPRCVKPSNAIGNPTLVTFSDASNDAFGACSYFRWKVDEGQYESNLIASKSRVSPVKTISIVKLELCAAVLGARLAKFIKGEYRYEIEREIFIVDSQIVKSMLNKDSYGFHTFAAVRIGEIQNTTDIKDWFWLEGRSNIADWITRKKYPADIAEQSIWQKGPEFMKGSIDSWGGNNTLIEEDLPEELKRFNISLVQEINNINDVIDITRYSKYRALMQVTARILQITKDTGKPSLKGIFMSPSVETLKSAEKVWIKDAQRNIIGKLEKGSYSRLCPVKDGDGIYKVYGRNEQWLKDNYNNEGLVLLPANHRISYLYALYIHNRDHLAVNSTVCKIRNKFWIPHIGRIVQSICNKCVTCKKLKKKTQEQIMGTLPDCRLKPSPAFHVTYLDLFGPFTIRGVVNKRTRNKCFGIIFTCGGSRAVYCDVTQDYSTDSFLQAARRFISLRGYPSDIYSDSGSQLVKADKEIRKQKVIEYGVEKGLTWHFSTPTAPWKNGCAESLIKSIKKALTVTIGDQVLSFPELQTYVFEAANLINERPIAVHTTNLDDGSYICPNDLLLGRASSSVPSGPFPEYTSPKKRLAFIQLLVDSFWKKWIRDYFPSLLIRQKWHTEKRPLQMGDIVLIQDLSALRGQWKLGKVSKVHTSVDNIVRNVDVQYKNDSSKRWVTVERPVQRLVVILPVEDS